MHRSTLLLTLLSATLITNAQSGTIRPAPAWGGGERREVSVDRTIRMTIDSSTYNLTSHSSYALEVVGARKDGFTLSIRTRSTDQLEMTTKLMDLITGAKQDNLKQFMEAVAEGLYKPLDGLETRFNVTLTGEVQGQVDAIGTVEKLRPAMAKVITNMTDTIAQYRHKQPEALPQARMDYLTDSLYALLSPLQVHELNYLMRIYGTTFPLTGSQRGHVTVKDVGTPLHRQYPSLPARIEVGLDEISTDALIGRTITTYDPDSLYAGMLQDKWASKVKPADVSLVEERVEGFDRSVGWPTSSTAEMEFHCGPLRMHVTTKTVFTKVR